MKPAIYKAEGMDVDVPSGDKYVVSCNRHSTFTTTRTLKDAKQTDTLDFCDECRDKEEAE